jgi:excisionase family DNA binding protein
MEQLLSVGGAAHRLGRSERTIRKWADAGRLEVFTRLADGSRLFRESVVEAAASRKEKNQ